MVWCDESCAPVEKAADECKFVNVFSKMYFKVLFFRWAGERLWRKQERSSVLRYFNRNGNKMCFAIEKTKKIWKIMR